MACISLSEIYPHSHGAYTSWPLPILEAPHPILSQKARVVTDDEFGPELVQYLENMAETMYDAPGVGLAAPQVGDSRRILVADPSNNDDQDLPTLYKMVNPTVLSHSEELISYEESCLSVPEFYLNVRRFKSITLEWRDGMGVLPIEKCLKDSLRLFYNTRWII